MEHLCRYCGYTFQKELTLKEKSENYQPKFCSQECAMNSIINKEKEKNKNNRLPQSSKQENQFGEMLKSFLPKLQKQYKLKNYYHHYDFYSPELNIIIEYNGVYWHNMPRNRIKDKKHLAEAIRQKIDVAIVTDKEWKKFLDSGMPDKQRLLILLNQCIKNVV